ncbi:metal ABC transporter solute-binding protein, Zn/Mn family [Guyparkeria sp. SCN-R1]|uniref:metal ABC transporter solute-binding protein, Zn/Mn family n=1 Tax=Guyparkeria sp. SCN-R1 TaxID=2341113 RepID=UPI00131542E9|nr:zinc ABC transporter substrate-binding protein [Guyparkeria sp. SCN-R1]
MQIFTRWLSRVATLSLAVVFLVPGVQAQDEVLQYGGGDRDVEPLRVVVDTSFTAELVDNIAGSFVEVEAVVDGEESPLAYSLDKDDRERIESADLVVYQGLGLMPEFIQAAEAREKTDRVVLTDRIPDFRLIETEDGVNPHTYHDPSLLQYSVDHLTIRLKERLETVAGEIEGNRLRINIELQSLMRETEGLMEDVPRSERVLVTDNDVFAYFAKAYHFELLDVTDEEQSEKAIELIERNETPNVFTVAGAGEEAIEEWLEAKRGSAIPESVGMAPELTGLWLGDSNLPTGTYIGLFRENVSEIILGLKPLPEAGSEAPAE